MSLKVIFSYISILIVLFSKTSVNAQSKYQKDFEEFCTVIDNYYAYLEQQHIDWQKVRAIYEPESAKVTNDTEFIRLLENVLHELYNGHSSLNVNLTTSNRLIPSGLDISVTQQGNRYWVTDLRKGFGADIAGIKTGMEVIAFNGKPIIPQLQQFLPKFTDSPTPLMIQYAIDMLFAGTHDTKRTITVLEKGKEKMFNLVSYSNSSELLAYKIINSSTAYIKFNNSLGNTNVIAEFDKAVDSLFTYHNLIIDLTETPSGGNTTVARAIMGRFITEQLPYQIHEFDEKEYKTKRHWVEYVTPRKTTYQGQVYLLVGRWTGSMGEGIAIGFNGMRRAQVIGTKMAGLLGAISNFSLSETKIGVQFPTERLYHINGTPRENFSPDILTQNIEETILKAKVIK